MANSLPVSRAVSVSLSMSPIAAAGRDFGAVLVIGTSSVIPVSERIREYGTYEEILEDFGALAPETLAANAFFSQEPKPSQLFIGRWVKAGVAAAALGAIIPEANQDVGKFTGISSGSLSLKIDGVSRSAAGLDFSKATNYNAVASVIGTAIGSYGACAWDGSRFRITSATSGKASSVSEITSSNSDLLTALGFNSVTYSAGFDAESVDDAFTAFLDTDNWYACFIADENLTTESALSAASQVLAASLPRIIAFTSRDSGELDSQNESTLGARLKALGNNRALVVYSSNSSYAAMSFLARMSVVNYEGSDTTLTMKFKQLPGFEAEHLTTSQANALQAKNVNAFVAYQNGTNIVQEGVMSGGWFADERKDLDWLSDYVQTAVWNLLYTSGTKILQTDAGVNRLVSAINKAVNQGVVNGLIGPGVWNGDEFGALKTGDTLTSGYYIYAQPVSQQSQSDREARKAPAIQVAVKLAGAVHFAEVAISVNR